MLTFNLLSVQKICKAGCKIIFDQGFAKKSDVWGLVKTPTEDEEKYYVTLNDDYSNCSFLHLLKNKPQATDKENYLSNKSNLRIFPGYQELYLIMEVSIPQVNSKGIAKKSGVYYTFLHNTMNQTI